jgi:hypothetical protein
LLKIFFIFLLLVPSFYTKAQSDSANSFLPDYDVDSLRNIYGEHKHILKEYELQTLVALSYYPELLHEHIRFKYGTINSTAQTTVTLGSIFKKITKQYIIIINNYIKKTGLLLSDAPFEAQVALIGHELSHVIDFKRRGFFDMVWWGISYLIVKQRTKIEIRADKSAIRHQLGWPLYYWADFVLNHSKANKRYKRMKEKKYMQPDEILKYMKEYEKEN